MTKLRSLTLASIKRIHAVHPAPSDAFFRKIDEARGRTMRSNLLDEGDPVVAAFVASLPPDAFYAEAARLMTR